jgi:hypothetical protein
MLESVRPLPFQVADVEALAHCYISATDALDELKVDIRKAQARAWQRLCPYCAIDTSSTFDHYLCRATFPEFSVLSDNLIPACSVCNTKKGNKELDGGRRRFIHFYVDEIPDARWLHCQIVVTGDEPEALFEVSFPASFPLRAREIMEQHYQRLELPGRFGERAVQTLVNTMSTGHRDTLDGYALQFANKADRLGEEYGHNYWESRLYDAMAQSEAFLQLLV